MAVNVKRTRIPKLSCILTEFRVLTMYMYFDSTCSRQGEGVERKLSWKRAAQVNGKRKVNEERSKRPSFRQEKRTEKIFI